MTLSEAVKLCRKKGLHNAFETSAKTGLNVEELFFNLTKHLYLNNKAKLESFVSENRFDDDNECVERKRGHWREPGHEFNQSGR